jgi:hypothetical protein
LFASVNHGAPAVAATARAGQFSGAGIIGAKGAQPLAKTINAGRPPGGQAKGPRPNFQKATTGLPKKPEQHAKRPEQHPKKPAGHP